MCVQPASFAVDNRISDMMYSFAFELPSSRPPSKHGQAGLIPGHGSLSTGVAMTNRKACALRAISCWPSRWLHDRWRRRSLPAPSKARSPTRAARVVPGATVTITNEETGVSQTSHDHVAPATTASRPCRQRLYTIRVSLDGSRRPCRSTCRLQRRRDQDDQRHARDRSRHRGGHRPRRTRRSSRPRRDACRG